MSSSFAQHIMAAQLIAKNVKHMREIRRALSGWTNGYYFAACFAQTLRSGGCRGRWRSEENGLLGAFCQQAEIRVGSGQARCEYGSQWLGFGFVQARCQKRIVSAECASSYKDGSTAFADAGTQPVHCGA